MHTERNAQVYAEQLASMLRMNTVSTPGQTELGRFYQFHELLRELFPLVFKKAEIIDFDGSLFIKISGGDMPPVMLMSHMDVVEAGEGWIHEPFGGEIADGRVWGRGALDTKGNLWAIFSSAEQLLEDEAELPQDIYIVSSCDEETDGRGGRAISAYMLENDIHPELLLDEGGMIIDEPVNGFKGRFAMMGVAEKVICDVRLIARSKGGHASAPWKNSPLVRLGRFMYEAERKELFKVKINRVTREMFQRIAAGKKGMMGFLFRNLWLTRGIVCKAIPSVSDAGAAMLKTTLAFTMASGSEGVNVMPSQAYIVGDMRCSLHEGIDSSLSAVSRLATRYGIEVKVFDRGEESPATDFKGKTFRAVESVIRDVFSNVSTTPYILNGASDSRFYGKVCNNCIRFAPFSISSEQLSSMHAAEESIDIETLPAATEFYKRVIMRAYSA